VASDAIAPEADLRRTLYLASAAGHDARP